MTNLLSFYRCRGVVACTECIFIPFVISNNNKKKKKKDVF